MKNRAEGFKVNWQLFLKFVHSKLIILPKVFIIIHGINFLSSDHIATSESSMRKTPEVKAWTGENFLTLIINSIVN